ncbi:MAG: hypothetical protein AAF483_22250 [Planctomycetota bacterium]
MSKRERFLALAVVAIIGLVGFQWGFNNVVKGLDEKYTALDDAQAEKDRITDTVRRGNEAADTLRSLAQRSLPTDREKAIFQYRNFLADLGGSVGMNDIYVSQPETTTFANTAYDAYRFTLRGDVDLDEVFELLGQFYDKNYLHRIRSFKMLMLEDGRVSATMQSEVIAIKAASKTQDLLDEPSGRLAMPVDEYKEKILNRNPFAPPNVAPRMASDKGRVEITVGDQLEHSFEAKDPEGHRFVTKLVSEQDDVPDGLRFGKTGFSWTPNEKQTGNHELLVEFSDYGWPAASRQEKVFIRVKAKKVEYTKPEPNFDISSQAFISGMVYSNLDGKTAWIRSRIEDKSYSVTEGDSVEIGDLAMTVIAINLEEGLVELDTKGIRWTVDQDTPLSEAYKKSLID